MPEWDELDDDSIESTVEAEDFATDSDEHLSDEEKEKGYLRLKDYTKKTQEAAKLRKEAEAALNLQRALEQDPASTLAYLAQQYGFSQAQADEDLLPLEREILELRNRVEAQERLARAEKLEATALKAIAEYNLDDVEPDDLVRYMLSEDIGNARTAARLMALDKKGQASESRKEKVTAQKRTLPTSSGSRQVTTTEKPKSFAEAYELAKRGVRV